jgi:hypothetical protein
VAECDFVSASITINDDALIVAVAIENEGSTISATREF